MLYSKDVSLDEAALLVIDIQDSFKINPDRWDNRNNPHMEANVTALIQAFQQAGLPIFYFLHTDGDPGFNRDSPYFKLMDYIEAIRGDAPLILKSTRNCFTSTDLQMRLVELGVRRLFIAGIQMEQCCETTARVAADLGYAVDFVLDATMTFPITNPDNLDEVLSVDKIEERTIFALRRRFANIVYTQDVIGALAETA